MSEAPPSLDRAVGHQAGAAGAAGARPGAAAPARRPDCHRRHGLPRARRRRHARAVLATAARWHRRRRGSARRPLECRRLVRRRPGRYRQVGDAGRAPSCARSTDSTPAISASCRAKRERMDPQQRLFLEVAIEALDDAGLTRDGLRGSRTGVFVASYHNDYAQLQYNDIDAIDLRTLTGTLHSVLANRLSHFLDLRGPSLSIDTACSSSLVAIHLACQSLRCGESDVARGRWRVADHRRPSCSSRCPRSGSWRRMVAARPSTPPPTASVAAKAAASSC